MYVVELLTGGTDEKATFASQLEAETYALSSLLHEELVVVIWDMEQDKAAAIVFQGEVFRP